MFDDVQFLLFIGSALLATVAITVYIVVKAITTPYPVVERSHNECCFQDSETGERQPFPRLCEPPSLLLSIVVPAFDEELRLPAMLDEAVLYLRAKELAAPDRFTYEIIVVSDGSRDRTVEVAQSYCRTVGSNKVRVLALERNRGKGGAVRLGVQSARGRLILFADADGATQFDELDKLLAAVQPHLGPEADGSGDAEALAIGSRAHLEAAAMAERSLFRTVLMHGFHALVWLFAVRGVRDTQCGFKLFTRRAARTLFGLMHVERWAFDVEVLFVAQHLRMPIAELAVRWTEIDGSKVVPVWSWLQMGRDLVVIWFRYAIGAWSLRRMREADGSEDGMGTWGGKKLL